MIFLQLSLVQEKKITVLHKLEGDVVAEGRYNRKDNEIDKVTQNEDGQSNQTHH